MTIFQKIIDGEIPASKVYEDDQVLAFRDIQPQAPVHILVIPKKPIVSAATAQPEDEALMGKLLDAGPRRGGIVRAGTGQRLRVEGRDARGVLVVHGQGAHVAGRRGHGPDRRRRR